MLSAGLLRFSGQPAEKIAWQNLVSTQDVVGIKVHSAPGRTSGTRPVVVAALIESMLRSGISRDQIVIWDRRSVDLRLAGYYELAEKYKVGIAGAVEAGYDRDVSYSTPLIGKLVYGDLEFGKKGEGVGRNSYASKLVSQRLTKIINVTPLLNHNQAGVSGALYGLATASVDNILRFEDPERLGTAIPEIYGMSQLADKVVLNIVDALICQYRGEERSLLHYSTVLNQLWFSRDPVAVDALAIKVLEENRAETQSQKNAPSIYANAELMELGIADPKRLNIERLKMDAKAESSGRPAGSTIELIFRGSFRLFEICRPVLQVEIFDPGIAVTHVVPFVLQLQAFLRIGNTFALVVAAVDCGVRAAPHLVDRLIHMNFLSIEIHRHAERAQRACHP